MSDFEREYHDAETTAQRVKVLTRARAFALAVYRPQRQDEVFAWAERCFGKEESHSLPQRALRSIEETTEACQAVGLTEEQCHQAIRHVYSNPPGNLAQELGGMGVTLLALAAAAGLDADEEELREVKRILSKPPEHFAARNAAKNTAGLKA